MEALEPHLIWECLHMALLFSMAQEFPLMKPHFLEDQHTLTIMEEAFLEVAPTDRCLCLDHHHILVDP